MVQYGGISCWIEIENKTTPEYHIQTFSDQRIVACWIASDVGKSFSVAWKNAFLPAPTAGHVFMDGNECGGRVLHGPSALCARHEGVTDTRMVRQFTFSSLTLTDDDVFLRDSPNHQKLGQIEVAIYPVEIFGFVPVISNSSTLPEIKVHERSKGTVTQQIKLAEPKVLPIRQTAIAHRFIGPPLVTFVFRYRPLGMYVLQAIGIAPVPPQAIGIAPAPPQRKRKPVVEPPREPPSDDDLSDVEEIRALREKLHALEAKRAQKAKKIRVKEEENIPPVDGRNRKKVKLNAS
ncbi:hypothetical protein B0H19DRAFT_1247116 [Mycena capillaripes]|nr:hypothetical protein B0H19DRAFT_1247116 [Mycena capillaripes]